MDGIAVAKTHFVYVLYLTESTHLRPKIQPRTHSASANAYFYIPQLTLGNHAAA